MKIIFLHPYPIGESPSQRFRFEQYFEKLEAQNITYSCQSFWTRKSWYVLYKQGHHDTKFLGFLSGIIRRFGALPRVLKADFVFIHRECLPVGPPIIEWIIAKILQKKIIFDFDDAIWLPNTSTENKLAAFIKWHSKTRTICRWSHVVSCGNSFLASFAKQFNRNVVVNPTTIDTLHLHNPSLYKISKQNDIITIGWTGSHSTIKYLYPLIHVFQELEKKYNQLRFIVIANKNPNLKLKSLLFIPWSKEDEIERLLQFDIGVMPLPDDMWAKGKCGFKALQYMALGIPTLASPVGVNTEIITNAENGFLCKEESEWFDYLSRLIEQPELYKQIGINARKKIIEAYSISSNVSTFLSLFE